MTLVCLVVDELNLARVCAVQSAGVLLERIFPGNRHGEEERVETCVVEALAGAAAVADEHSRCIVWEAANSSAVALRAKIAGHDGLGGHFLGLGQLALEGRRTGAADRGARLTLAASSLDVEHLEFGCISSRVWMFRIVTK